MEIKKLQTLVVSALEDVKAQDIKVYDTTTLTSLFDRICVASGTSNRQTKALASSVRDKVKENGGNIVSIEGEEIGEWVLVDLGDMVVHIMQPVIRDYYRLEELWGEKEVKIVAAKRSKSKRAAEETVEDKPVKRRRSINQATQTTVEEEVKKSVRKPRAAEDTHKKTTTRKKTMGTTVKVAPSKKAMASAKEAAAKRVSKGTTKRTPLRKTAG